MSMNRTHISFPASLYRLGRPLFLVCTLSLLAGCAAEPVKTFYTAPDQEDPTPASIIGARATAGYTSDEATYLTAIDGLPIENAKANSAYEVKVTPGYRALTVAHAQDSLQATSEITTELKAGRSYILKAEKTPVGGAASKNTQGDGLYNIWLEDSLTQEVVGVKHLAKLNTVADNISNPAMNGAAGDFLIKLVGVVLEAMIDTALAPDNHRSTNNASVISRQPASSVESAPIRRPTATQPVQNPKPGKAFDNSAPQGNLKKQ